MAGWPGAVGPAAGWPAKDEIPMRSAIKLSGFA